MKLELTWDKAVYWMIRDRIPVTRTLMVLACLGFVGFQIPALGRHIMVLAFNSGELLPHPWTLFTYILLPSDYGFISFIFSCYWLWYAGGQLEHEWGSLVYAAFMAGIVAVSALGMAMAAPIVKTDLILLGLWLPLAGVTTAFCLRNPEGHIMFCCIIPLKLKYLLALTVAAVIFSYLRVYPAVVPFALIGCGCAAWFVRAKMRGSFVDPRRQDDGKVIRVFDRKGPTRRVPREKPDTDDAAQERLKDFFKRSGIDDK